MNYRMIGFAIGRILLVEAALLLLPMAVALGPNTAPQQFLSQHLKDRRLAAATDTGKYLDERLVDKRLDCRDIVRSVDHRIASLQLIVYPK